MKKTVLLIFVFILSFFVISCKKDKSSKNNTNQNGAQQSEIKQGKNVNPESIKLQIVGQETAYASETKDFTITVEPSNANIDDLELVCSNGAMPGQNKKSILIDRNTDVSQIEVYVKSHGIQSNKVIIRVSNPFTEYASLQKSLSNAKESLAKAKNDLAATQGDIENYNRQLSSYQSQKTSAKNALDSAKKAYDEACEKRIRVYREGIGFTYEPDQDAINAAWRVYKQADSDYNAIIQKIDLTSSQISTAQKKCTTLQNQINSLNKTISDLESQIKNVQSIIDSLSNK